MMRIRIFLLAIFFSNVVCVMAQDQLDCDASLEIWQIQGAGEQAHCIREKIILEENIVTATGIRGFFIQTPPDRIDNDPLTSDGIYVYTDKSAERSGVQVGDRVTIEGRIAEYYDLTQIEAMTRSSVQVVSSGEDIPEPVDLTQVDLNWVVGKDVHPLERYEGMLVTLDDREVVAPTNYFDEFGVTITGGRAFRDAGIEIDLNPEFADQGLPEADLNPELLEIDPPEMGLPVEFVTVGSRVSVTGGLSYAYRDYQIWPRELEINLANYAVRPVRAVGEGEFTIATQNALNLFDLVDDPERDDRTYEDYVPDTEDFYQLRLRKFSEQIRLNLGAPDILAIQEIENARVLTDLIFQIAHDDPGLRYTSCFQEGNDRRGIDNAFLVKVDRVNMNACYRMPGSIDARAPITGGLLYGRPPLVLEADLLLEEGESFPVSLINVHIKSLTDADTTLVQERRMAQSEGIAAFVQDILAENANAHIVVLGDFNAFQFSDGLVDVVGIISGTTDPSEARMAPDEDTLEPNLINQILRLPESERYSYIYNSTSQVLDHILTSPALDAYVTDAQFSRGNADALYLWESQDNGALRTSDHDGFVIYIQPATD